VYLKPKPSQKHVFCEYAGEQYIATQKLTLWPSQMHFLENPAKQGGSTRLADATDDAKRDSHHGFDWLNVMPRQLPVRCHVNFQSALTVYCCLCHVSVDR
jgi:hypothetical protein